MAPKLKPLRTKKTLPKNNLGLAIRHIHISGKAWGTSPGVAGMAWALLCVLLLSPRTGLGQSIDSDSLANLLIEAVELSDAKVVKSFLRKGVDPNATVSSINPAYNFEIHSLAVSSHGSEDGSKIGKMHSDTDALHDNGTPTNITPLHANAVYPNPEILQLLLKAGAQVNASDSQGRTPLMYALTQPDGENHVLQLLQAGANYTTRDQRGNSTLHYAALGGNLESIRLTASGGVDLNTPNEEGVTPLHIAAIRADRKVLEAFIELGANLSIRDNLGRNVLHYAAPHGHQDEVEYLYDLNPSLFSETKKGSNPLDLAYASKNTAVALFFRRKGYEFSDFHYRDLIEALERTDTGAVLKHLLAGANPNRDPSKQGPPNTSGNPRDPNHADAPTTTGNQKNQGNRYPIHIAAANGDATSLRHLIRFGAKLDQADPEGRTALAIALEAGHPECASFLMEQGARPADKWLPTLTWNLRDAEYRTKWSTVVAVIATKVDNIDTPGGDLEMPALHYAAYLGLPGLAQQLIAAGANPRQTDQHGWTPLHWAVIKREIIASIPEKVTIATLLIEKGASTNARTNQPKELPHRQPYLARRIPGNATPIDLLNYALPKDSNMMALLNIQGSQPAMLAADFFENGTELLKLDLFDAAQVEFNKCLKREPEFAEAYYYRGISKQALNMPESAAIDFEQAIQYRPFYPEAWLEAGKTNLDLKNYPAAETHLTKALSQGIRTGEIHYLLGVTKLKQDRVEEACQDFSSAAAQNDPTAKEAIELYCK